MESPMPLNVFELDAILEKGDVKRRVLTVLTRGEMYKIDDLKCWAVKLETADPTEYQVVAHFWRTELPPVGKGRGYYKLAIFRAQEGWAFGDVSSPPLNDMQLAVVQQCAEKIRFD